MNPYQASSLIRLFGHLLSPSRKPTSPMSPNCSDDIHHVFNYFDENGDGKITAVELKNMLRDKVQLSDEEAEMVVTSKDVDGDGVLGLDDFVKMMKEGEEEELKEAFVMYSMKSSVITPKSLKKMMGKLGQESTVNECKVMIRRFDVNGDGVLDFDEFRVMMMS